VADPNFAWLLEDKFVEVARFLLLFMKSVGSRSASTEAEGSGPLQNWAIRASVLGFLSNHRRKPLTMLAPELPVSTKSRDEPSRKLSMESAREAPTGGINELACTVAPTGATRSEEVPEGVTPLAENAEVYAGWVQLVRRIRCSETDGMAELYHLFSKGIRSYLCRQLGIQEVDDRIHDTFVVVVQAIRRGELRQPERLMGFVRTVVRRQVSAHIDKAVQTRRGQIDSDAISRVADPHENQEEAAISHQREDLIQKVLAELPSRDREILTRFYLQEQSQEEICNEMILTETQFRLLKSRAKSRFGELGKKKLLQRALSAACLRTFAGVSH
jgi:RNA polymerase sigma-70 factor, ECF subfamily